MHAGQVKLLEGSAFMRRTGLARLCKCCNEALFADYVEQDVPGKLVRLIESEEDCGVRRELYTCVLKFAERARLRHVLQQEGAGAALQRARQREAPEELQVLCEDCLARLQPT